MPPTSNHPSAEDWLLRLRPFLVFVPVVIAILIWTFANASRPPAAAIALFLTGLAAWTLLEYGLHRAMHVQPFFPGMAWVQAFHLGHHREPEDLEHAVISLRGSIPLAFLFLGIARLLFGNLPSALMFLAGLVTGYLFYELVHLADHARVRWPLLRQLMRYHARHHFQDDQRTFGVTTPLWDWVFATLPNKKGTGVASRQRLPSPVTMSGPIDPEPVQGRSARATH